MPRRWLAALVVVATLSLASAANSSVKQAQKGTLSCDAFVKATKAAANGMLALSLVGSVITAKQDHYEALSAAPYYANSTAPQSGFEGRKVWTGQLKGQPGTLTVVWNDACDADVFHLDIGLPSVSEGSKVRARSIQSVPCPPGSSIDSCTWLAEITHDPLPHPASRMPPSGGKLRHLSEEDAADAAEHAADLELLRLVMDGDSDATHHFHRNGGRHLQEERAAIMPSGRRLDDGSLINVLMVYTQNAETAAGGSAQIVSRIAAAAATSTQVLSNSQLSYRMQFSYAKVTYTESTTAEPFGAALGAVTNNQIPSVFGWRDTYKYDLVQLMINAGGYCGHSTRSVCIMIFKLQPSGSLYNHISNSPSRIHRRLGPTGAYHDKVTDKGSTPGWPYAWGYRQCGSASTTKFNTIMAYNDWNCAGQTGIPYYSSSTLKWNGVTMGSAGEDNIRVFKETSLPISNYRITAAAVPGSVNDLGPDKVPANIVSVVCPAGTFVNTINARGGSWIDAISSIVCYNPTTKSSTTLAVNIGGSGGGAVAVTASGGFIAASAGNVSGYLSQLKLTRSDGTVAAAIGGSGTAGATVQCPSGTTFIGVRASANGPYADGFGFVCGK
ncbi:hypothetical protein JKP88DRAFT_242157 [Tribonema minus]|uniref:Uncharacterized protein n=1 Tax=Tribonema minus TaxID=303371 RepID=A0A835YMZ0_9STRA|nr:hypothetical protein JKP88DRAFT_242157 [Tribonema minus]